MSTFVSTAEFRSTRVRQAGWSRPAHVPPVTAVQANAAGLPLADDRAELVLVDAELVLVDAELAPGQPECTLLAESINTGWAQWWFPTQTQLRSRSL